MKRSISDRAFKVFSAVCRRLSILSMVAAGSIGVSWADTLEVDLRLDLAAAPGEVALSWSGGSPQFHVYRSTDPGSVIESGNRVATTLEYTLDDPAPGDILFYRVASEGDCFKPVADTFVRDDEPATAFGSDIELKIDAGTITARSYLRFHVGTIPDGARIDEATLWLRQTDADGDGTKIAVYQVSGPWLESTLTWSSQPDVGSQFDEQVQPPGTGLRSWDVTDAVSGWIDGSIPEDGLVLAGAPEPQDYSTSYASREPGSATAPRLCVVWTDPVIAAIDGLSADSSTGPIVEFDEGVVISVEVDIPTGGDDDTSRALDFLERHGKIHGIDNPHDQLFLDRIEGGQDGQTVVFGVRGDDARVRGEHVAVVVREGRVRGTLARLDPGRRMRGGVGITGLQAEQAALGGAGLAEASVEGIARPEWLNPNLQGSTGSDTRRTFRVTVIGRREDNGRRETRTVHVDAETAAVLRVWNETEAGDRPGEDFDIRDAAQTAAVGCWFPSDEQWFDDDGPTGYPGAAFDLFLDGQNANDAAHDSYHFFYGRFGLRSWDDDDEEVQAMVHRGTDNAFYDSFCDHLEFGDDFAKLDIFAHEFGHALDGNTADLDSCNEPGAVGESFSDVFAALVDGNWLIGEDVAGRPPFRDMEDPPRFGDPDHVLASVSGDGVGKRSEVDDPDFEANDNGWVHVNSGIPNKAAFLTIEGGFHNGLVVTAIGSAKGAQLYYETLRARLTEESKIVHTRAALIGVARDFRDRGLHGFDTADVCSVINAWSSVGLGDPDTDCDGVPNLPSSDGDDDGIPDVDDQCPNLPDPEQPDLDGDEIGDACDRDLDGDGWVNTEDNCARIPNPDQTDSDLDGFGDPCNDRDNDGWYDDVDNCPHDNNPGQEDADGDEIGDLCDADRDGDGVAGSDVCPRVPDPQQLDGDNDGVGDACDNCPAEHNDGQRDTDRDGLGDACDSDDDNDGIEDGSDNCDTVWNPLQQDHDGDNEGTFCDDDELQPLDSAVPDLTLLLSFFDPADGHPIRLPVFPCRTGLTCPDRLGDDWFVEVQLELSRDYWVRMIDDRGFTVAKSTRDGTGMHTLRFEADPDSHWLDLQSGLPDPFEGRRYFLELLAPPSLGPGLLEGTVGVNRVSAGQ